MPQPITHYLIVRRGIPKKYWEEYWNENAEVNYKPYFGLGSSAPDLFYLDFSLSNKINSGISFLNAMLRKNDFIKQDSKVISDAIHGDQSFDVFCHMLNEAKKTLSIDSVAAKKKLAFAIGFYGHVIGDCIIHPYVYRKTGDHWATKDFTNEAGHKIFECRVDKGLYEYVYEKKMYTTRDFSWQCVDKDDSELLDKDIWSLFNSALGKEYAEDIYTTSIDENRLNNSYKCFVRISENLLKFDAISACIDTDDDNEFFKSKISSTNLPNLSPLDLCEIACNTCRVVFQKAFAYFEDEHANGSKEYFMNSDNSTHYLNGNDWNLDTGLLSAFNNEPEMLKECPTHFDCHIDELQRTYEILALLPGFDEQ